MSTGAQNEYSSSKDSMFDFSLGQLEAFVTTAECASFSAAAKTLFLSQSTVSNHIAALEASLGVTLLERGSRRKVELTENGREFYERGKTIVKQCADLQRSFIQRTSELVIGASTVPLSCVLPRLMSRFRQRNPDCRFFLKKGNSGQIHDLLEDGQIEIGLVGTVLDRKNLSYRTLCTDRLILVTPNSSEYKSFLDQGLPGRALLTRALIVRTPGSGTQIAVNKYLREAGISPDKNSVIAQIESNETILESVSHELGNAVVSALSAQSWIEEGRLLGFELEQDRSIERQMYIVCRKRAKPNSLSQQFIEFALGFCKANFD